MIKKITIPIIKVIVFTLLTFYFQLSTFKCFSQGGAAINTTGSAADNSAMLDVSSINQGMRIPRVALISTTLAAPITNPANSLLVYDSVTSGDVTPGFYYWDGIASRWIKFSTGSGSGWSTSGNSGTDTVSNFIGTTDDRSWVMKTNSTERMKISKTGSVVIGATNPASSAILDVNSTTKGQLIPRMTTSARNTIASPAIGLQIFNTDCNTNEYYTGACWVSLGKSLRAPGSITTDTTSFCARTTHTYTIVAVPTVTDYTWTVPAGSKILSGQGSTSITVSFGSITGSVCVTANNNCETSPASCIDVYVSSTPLTPGNITGPITAVPGQTSPVSYSIASIPGATAYNWTVPPGASITSGLNTTNIVVNYSCNTTAGYVAVTQTAACGISTPASLAIAVNPLSITAGAAKVGPGTLGGSPTATGGYGTYVYAWSPSSGISATNTANPTATACATTTYILTVTDINTCSATSSVIVTRNITANAGADINVFSYGTISIGPATGSGGGGSYTYSWSPTAGLSSSTIANPTASINGTYTITITDVNNCTATSSMSITSLPGVSPVTAYYKGSVVSWAVPTGVTSITIETWGAESASSGGTGGLGGYSKGTLSTTEGTIYNIRVGGQGGWNGGGVATNGGVNGGGASDVRTSGDALANRIIVAGGGGGRGGHGGNAGSGTTGGGAGGNAGNQGGIGGSVYNATYGSGGGGGGGAFAGANGTNGTNGSGFTGGTGGAGNATGGGYGTGGAGTVAGSSGTAGTLGQGGNGGTVTTSCYGGGGGGGGGYYGGGGGGGGGEHQNCSVDNGGGGGGGGSNYIGSLSNTSIQNGIQSGNGKVVITW